MVVNKVMAMAKPIVMKIKKKILGILKPILKRFGISFGDLPKDPFPQKPWMKKTEPLCDGGTDPEKNLGVLERTCYNNKPWAMRNGVNMCHCCFAGAANYAEMPIASSYVLELRKGVCPLVAAATSEKVMQLPKEPEKQSPLCKRLLKERAAAKAEKAEKEARRRRSIKIPSIGKAFKSVGKAISKVFR